MKNYFDYLKNKFPLYLITGIILAVLAVTSVLASRYDRHLMNVLYDLQSIHQKKDRIHEQVRDIDSMLDYFKNRYKLDIAHVSPERQILSTLDHIKSHMPDANITVSSFEKKTGNLQLPVTIQLHIDSYSALVNAVSYIDSLGIPDYKIQRLQILEGQVSGLVLVLSGSLSMPATQT